MNIDLTIVPFANGWSWASPTGRPLFGGYITSVKTYESYDSALADAERFAQQLGLAISWRDPLIPRGHEPGIRPQEAQGQ